MSRRLFIGVFGGDHELLSATEAVRARGLRIVDVYTPYAVHGLDKAMGLAPSRLSRVCLVGGVLGTLLAMWFQGWATAVDWPLNVGGRPWNSWPAFVPITFEMMVLLAAFGVVIAFFAVSRLFPGKKIRFPMPGVGDDRFVLVVEESDAAFDAARVRDLFRSFHALQIEEREEDRPEPPSESVKKRHRLELNAVLLAILIVTAGANWLLGPGPARPNREFLPDMAHSPRYGAFAANVNFADGKTLRSPVSGTIPRGLLPLHYQATPEDALRAGKELRNPFPPGDALVRRHGLKIFANYCQICHGPEGNGDGPVTKRGVPPPPSLHADKARGLKDGQMFHILTFGQGNMASYAGQLSRDERWYVIRHVRELQKKTEKKQ